MFSAAMFGVWKHCVRDARHDRVEVVLLVVLVVDRAVQDLVLPDERDDLVGLGEPRRQRADLPAGRIGARATMYSIGRPLMPPLSLTQSKYAFAASETSVKSMPGILVMIAPTLIGSPVAFSPDARTALGLGRRLRRPRRRSAPRRRPPPESSSSSAAARHRERERGQHGKQPQRLISSLT